MNDVRVRVVIYDERTGETYDNAIPIGVGSNGPDIIIADSPEGRVIFFSKDLIRNEKLLKGPIRLLLYAISLADHDTSEVAIVPEKAIKELGITEKTFYRWLRVLMSKGHLIRIATNIYRLNLTKGTKNKGG
jgi:hypothetical protein